MLAAIPSLRARLESAADVDLRLTALWGLAHVAAAEHAPILEAWSNALTSAERASTYDQAKREELATAVDAWAEASGPEWFN